MSVGEFYTIIVQPRRNYFILVKYRNQSIIQNINTFVHALSNQKTFLFGYKRHDTNKHLHY
uniref:Uncharacterized protein n=1 Tax=Octopus bimaculoides TaxID=37653 RepID=A0A0L8GHP7_OCTBM